MSDADLIRTSFGVVAPRVDELLVTFYENLFDGRPQVRAMFPSDMSAQRQHLKGAVGLVVKHADNLDALTDALHAMGARHVGYGARPEHYAVVRDVMLATLAQIAGEAWTAEMERAWRGALDRVAELMLEGAAQSA